MSGHEFFHLTDYVRPKLSDFDEPLQDFAIVSVFTICATGTISVGALLIWHIYLILTNQTTVEFHVNLREHREALQYGQIYSNPFNQGWSKNIERVFGKGSESIWYKILVPVWPSSLEYYVPKYPDDVLNMNDHTVVEYEGGYNNLDNT